MKKIISILIAFVMVLCLVNFAFAETFGMSFMPKGISPSQTVSREVFSYSLSHLIDFGKTLEPTDTHFDDVKADNVYSGYIKSLADKKILNGVGDNLYNPKGDIKTEQISKVFVSLLGYDTLAQNSGGYPNGYLAVASELGLFKGVKGNLSCVTLSDLAVMIENLLKTPVAGETYIKSGDELKVAVYQDRDNLTFAEKYTSFYRFDGYIKEADIKTSTASVYLSKVPDESDYQAGEVKIFNFAENIDIRRYENADVTLLCDKDDNVIDIMLRKNVNVRFGVVDSVNNDISDKGYHISYLEELTLKGDDTDYVFTENTRFNHNGREYAGTMHLMGNFVRIITENDEITFIETWDLSEGGIIKSRSMKELMYKNQGRTRNLTGFSECSLRTVILDGEYINFSELPLEAVFYYYIDEENGEALIVASEQKISGTLESISKTGNKLFVDGLEIEYNTGLSVTTDGESYSSSADDIINLCNSEIKIAFDPFGRAYCIIGGESKFNEFCGYLLRYKEPIGIDETEKILVLDLEEGTVGGRELVLHKKVDFVNVSKKDFISSAGKIANGAIYEFSINASGEVTEVETPMLFEGFKTAKLEDLRSFIQASPPYLNVDSQRLYFDNNTPFYAIYESEDGWVCKKVTYPDITGRSVSDNGLTATFYGYPDKGEVRFVTLTGSVSLIEGDASDGIVDDMVNVLDENGDVATSINLGEKDYIISDSDALKVKKGMLVSLRTPLFGDKAVVESAVLLDTIFDETAVLPDSLVRVKLKRAYNNRVILDNGSTYFYYYKNDYNFWKLNSNDKFVKGVKEDLQDGDEVVLHLVSGQIKNVFYN